MKVLFDTSPLTNANYIRGVGVYTRFLSQELEKLEDANFSLLTSLDEIHEHVAARGNVEIVHYPFFDLFFHTLPIQFGVMRLKTVVTIHDLIPLLFPEQYPVGVKGSIRYFLQRLALTRVDAVITDSQASKNDIVRILNVEAEKVHVVYLAGNPEIQVIDNRNHLSEIRKKCNLPEKYILYVGDINYNKNIPELIKALTLVDESVHLVCVGKNFREQDISEWMGIQNTVDRYQLAERVHFITELGSDANHELSALYTMAICYVQPSLYEGFGLPVLEALQCKTPVVCAQNSSLIEVGGDVVEYVDTDAESIAKGITAVLNLEKGELENRKTAGKKWAETFSWEKTAKETKKVYEKLIR